jgi:spore germination cell wall hydrolase CwlJ-like protein
MAVAQVVVNRAFSGYYPNDICGVIYQNRHRHLACQFTYACDGIPDIVHSKAHWAVAERLANEALDGKGYLPDVGKATHYHAYYVSPYWARKMRKMVRIGAHTFYFPYEWEVDDQTVTAGK